MTSHGRLRPQNASSSDYPLLPPGTTEKTTTTGTADQNLNARVRRETALTMAQPTDEPASSIPSPLAQNACGARPPPRPSCASRKDGNQCEGEMANAIALGSREWAAPGQLDPPCPSLDGIGDQGGGDTCPTCGQVGGCRITCPLADHPHPTQRKRVARADHRDSYRWVSVRGVRGRCTEERRGTSEGSARARARANALTFCCPLCTHLVDINAASKSARKQGRRTLKAGDGCLRCGPHYRPSKFASAQRSKVEGLMQGKRVGRALASSGPDGVVGRPEISAPHPLDLTTDLWGGTRRSWTRSAAGGTQICGSGGADLGPGAPRSRAEVREIFAFLPKICARPKISGFFAQDLGHAGRDLGAGGDRSAGGSPRSAAARRHAEQDLAPFGRQIRSVLLHLGRTLGRAVWPSAGHVPQRPVRMRTAASWRLWKPE